MSQTAITMSSERYLQYAHTLVKMEVDALDQISAPVNLAGRDLIAVCQFVP
jgi:hypothetical protein